MKRIIVLYFLFFSVQAGAQDLDVRIRKKACSCFIQMQLSNTPSVNNTITRCLEEALESFSAEIKKIPDTAKAGSPSAVYTFVKKIIDQGPSDLIMECDGFYTYIDNLRKTNFGTVNTNQAWSQIREFDNEIKKDSSRATNYLERGMRYLQLKKFDEARADFSKYLTFPDASQEAIFFRGLTNEFSGRYEEAIKDYETLKKTDPDKNIDLYIAIAKRKMGRK